MRPSCVSYWTGTAGEGPSCCIACPFRSLPVPVGPQALPVPPLRILSLSPSTVRPSCWTGTAGEDDIACPFRSQSGCRHCQSHPFALTEHCACPSFSALHARRVPSFVGWTRAAPTYGALSDPGCGWSGVDEWCGNSVEGLRLPPRSRSEIGCDSRKRRARLYLGRGHPAGPPKSELLIRRVDHQITRGTRTSPAWANGLGQSD
jgi:hypothetical protein